MAVPALKNEGRRYGRWVPYRRHGRRHPRRAKATTGPLPALTETENSFTIADSKNTYSFFLAIKNYYLNENIHFNKNLLPMKTTLPTIILILFAWAAHGQIFVKPDAAGAANGSSWDDAYTELSSALNSATEGDEIWVAQGTYLPEGANATRESLFFLDLNVKLYGGFAGNESSLDDRGDYKSHPTILSGDVNGDDMPNNFTDNREDNCRHIMWTDTNITNETVIDGFFFQNGQTDDGDGSGNDRRGGAILSYGAPIIQNCTFSQNYGYFGGAVYPRGGFATGFRILNCDFTENEGRSGGCIYIVSLNAGLVENCTFNNNNAVFGSGIYNASSIDTIRNCTFENNNAGPDGRGAGIYNSEVFALIENCTFNDLSAADRTGAGIHNTSNDDPAEVLIRNCTFNRCEANWGGGVAAYSERTVVNIEDCEFNFNTAFANGACLTIAFQATVNLKGCIMSENTARFGGAVFLQNDSSVLNAENCNFLSNQSEVNGGVFHASSGGILDFQDCYFENNSTSASGTGSGGAISFLEDSLDVAQINIARCEFIGNFANGEGGAIRLQNTDAYIENSVFAFNMSGVDGAGGAIINNGAFRGEAIGSPLRLVNNTFALNQGNEADGILMWADPQGASSVSLQNNTFYHLGGLDIAIQDGGPDITSTGGNVSLNTSAEAFLNNSADILGVDPLLTDINTLDFVPVEGSPCIDAGIAENAPTEDIEKNERDENPDAGAYEYQGTVSTETSSYSSRLLVFPTISKNRIEIQSDLHQATELAHIALYDLKGRQLIEKRVPDGILKVREQLQLNHLPAGIYLVELTNNGKTQNRRVIKK